ncbi:MAG: SsrA-binding protein SmpB [Myxococcota bacterium]
MAKRKKEAPPPVEAFGDGIVAVNRRAKFDYELGDKFEAGLVLVGSEVKMLRETTADLTEAYVAIARGPEAWVHGLNIPERTGAAWGHRGKRTRKLLLHRHEIEHIKRAVERDGMTAVATRLYFRGGRAKLEFALARGKAKVDKRQSIKARDAEREARAAIQRGLRGERSDV